MDIEWYPVPAVVGLLALTALDLARHAVTTCAFGLVALLAVVLVVRTIIHPVFILIGGAAVGVAVEWF